MKKNCNKPANCNRLHIQSNLPCEKIMLNLLLQLLPLLNMRGKSRGNNHKAFSINSFISCNFHVERRWQVTTHRIKFGNHRPLGAGGSKRHFDSNQLTLVLQQKPGDS